MLNGQECCCVRLRSERPSLMHSPSLSEYLRRMLHYVLGLFLPGTIVEP